MAVAYEFTINKLLRSEVIEYPEKLIELCFTVVDKNKKLVPFFINNVQHEFLDTLNSFELPEEQEQFTALPNKFLEVSKGQHRIVILSENEPVGFFLLHSTQRVKEYSDNPKAMLLTALYLLYFLFHLCEGRNRLYFD